MFWVKGQIAAAVIMNTRLKQKSNVSIKKEAAHNLQKKDFFFLALLCKFGLNTMNKHTHHPSSGFELFSCQTQRSTDMKEVFSLSPLQYLCF